MKRACPIDTSKCIGCRSCTVACKERNGHQPDQPHHHFGETSQHPADLSAEAYTLVRSNRVADDEGLVKWVFVKRQCMHCLDPACASACPVKALHKTESGAVVYNESVCIGCRYCMIACPFNIPRFEYDRPVPAIHKCMFCTDEKPQSGSEEAVIAGRPVSFGDEDPTGTARGMPACVRVCPADAIRFADRDELVEFARRRIRFRGRSKYTQHIYGEHEAGGTSWMYISEVPFAKLGFNVDVGDVPLPEYTKPFLTGVPLVIILGAGLMTGFYWIVRRRDELARARFEAAAGSSDSDDGRAGRNEK